MKIGQYLFILGIIAGCQASQDTEPFDRSKVEYEVITMLNDYHIAIKEGGFAAEFDYLDQSNDFFWIPPGYESALDFDSVKTILLGSASAFEHVDLDWETLQAYPLSNTIATYSGIVKGTMTDTTGVDNDVRILESGTLIRREDGWQLLSGQSRMLETK